jgi:hypothetical protein
MYKETVSTIKGDLLFVEKHKIEFTSMSEFKQIETLLDTLEVKLQTFRQVLPRLDKRRGLINFGENALNFYVVPLMSLKFTIYLKILSNCRLEILILFFL